MEILLVTKDPILKQNISQKLKYENIRVKTTDYLINIPIEILYSQIDIVIIDSHLNQYELAQMARISKYHENIKIIILHRNSDCEKTENNEKSKNKINFCYLVPNYHFEDIAPLIKSIKFSDQDQINKDLLTFADISMNKKQHIVKRANQIIKLRKKEFYLLELFLLNPTRVLTKEFILNTIWDQSSYTLTNTIDSHVNNLRRRLEVENQPKIIHSVRGVGYKIALEE